MKGDVSVFAVSFASIFSSTYLIMSKNVGKIKEL